MDDSEAAARGRTDAIASPKGDSVTPATESRGQTTQGPGKVDDDDGDEGVLSPPPSSSVSSVDPAMLGDEIVVGTENATSNANGDKSSPLQVTSDKEDVEMTEAGVETPASHYPKRKRLSVYENLGEDKLDGSQPAEDAKARHAKLTGSHMRPPHMKGILLGYWRDSPVPNDAKKHAVIGFPDIRDRLRTRIQAFTREGEQINSRLFPIPPGPGGSWTTFDRTVFEDHLVGLDHNEIKEFIKIRLRQMENEELEVNQRQAELDAIKEAKRNLQINPYPETAIPPAIAYGKIVPENHQHGGRPESKRRRTGSSTIFAINNNASTPLVPSQTSTPTPRSDVRRPPPGSAQSERRSPVLPALQSQTPLQPQPPAQPSQSPTPAQAPVSAPTPPQQTQPQPQQIIQQPQQSFNSQPAVSQVSPAPISSRVDDKSYLGNLPGQRPTRILVGCWSRSSAKKDHDKHAVYGILGANDMFRVKLVRETMDGRFVDGNFPTGAGALWIPYEEVNFLAHIRDLSRSEMKEYVRVRQYQIDSGEIEDERVANETKAVYEAQRRAALNPKAAAGPPVHAGRHSLNAFAEEPQVKTDPNVHDLRDHRRGVLQDIRGRPVSEAEYRQNGRAASIDPLERTNSLARREVHKLEAAQLRQDRNLSQRGLSSAPIHTPPPAIVPSDNRAMLQENMVRLNGVWKNQETARHHGQQQAAQQQQQQQMQAQAQAQAHAQAQANAQANAQAQAQAQAQSQAQMMQMPPQQQPPQLPSQQMAPTPNMEEVRVLGNVTYSRKQTGPFAGKLVSRGEIITIDGEDYVEYRVLTKPTFF
ncbi:transcriptional corepressor Tup11 [Pestalotiopsis sp. 9143b]|nr:transcriptional corepressor Tup11 [Pestalotiopsis sp. 9143b]